jgi:hypothetical protein
VKKTSPRLVTLVTDNRVVTLCQWVSEQLFPLAACRRALEQANAYDQPQHAWNRWPDGRDLIWLLLKIGCHRKRLTLCLCEIAARVREVWDDAMLRPVVSGVVEAVETTLDGDPVQHRNAVRDAVARVWRVTADDYRHNPCAFPAGAAEHAARAVAACVAGDDAGIMFHLNGTATCIAGSMTPDSGDAAAAASFRRVCTGEFQKQAETVRRWYPWKPVGELIARFHASVANHFEL